MENVPPKLLSRSAAWACLLANFVIPGLGTLVVHRRAGIAQLLLSQLGFALTLMWGIWFAVACVRAGTFPDDIGPYFGLGLLGAVMFFAAWIWSLVSSLSLLNQARTQEQSHGVK